MNSTNLYFERLMSSKSKKNHIVILINSIQWNEHSESIKKFFMKCGI